jgi:hypothetical protein
MENREISFKDFVPLVEKLIWPVFIVIMILSFSREAREIYGIFKQRLTEGASIKIGGFLELGQKASETEIGQLGFANLKIEAIGGPAEAVSKESLSALDRLRQEIKAAPNRRIDTLRVDDGRIYSSTLLKDYVSTLGVRFIVFEAGGNFDGWMDAGIFVSQLALLRPGASPGELAQANLSYAEIRSQMAGISKESALPSDSAKQVLQKMQKLHIENLPIVKDNHFVFFANRGEILSNLITSYILEPGGQKPEVSPK